MNDHIDDRWDRLVRRARAEPTPAVNVVPAVLRRIESARRARDRASWFPFHMPTLAACTGGAAMIAGVALALAVTQMGVGEPDAVAELLALYSGMPQ